MKIYLDDTGEDKIVPIGNFGSNSEQTSYPICKVQVVVKKTDKKGEGEFLFKGRFYITLINDNIKVIDIQDKRIFDLVEEPDADYEAINSLALIRLMSDASFKLHVLCNDKDKDNSHSFIHKVHMTDNLPALLSHRSKQLAGEKSSYEIWQGWDQDFNNPLTKSNN